MAHNFGLQPLGSPFQYDPAFTNHFSLDPVFQTPLKVPATPTPSSLSPNLLGTRLSPNALRIVERNSRHGLFQSSPHALDTFVSPTTSPYVPRAINQLSQNRVIQGRVTKPVHHSRGHPVYGTMYPPLRAFDSKTSFRHGQKSVVTRRPSYEGRAEHALLNTSRNRFDPPFGTFSPDMEDQQSPSSRAPSVRNNMFMMRGHEHSSPIQLSGGLNPFRSQLTNPYRQAQVLQQSSIPTRKPDHVQPRLPASVPALLSARKSVEPSLTTTKVPQRTTHVIPDVTEPSTRSSRSPSVSASVTESSCSPTPSRLPLRQAPKLPNIFRSRISPQRLTPILLSFQRAVGNHDFELYVELTETLMKGDIDEACYEKEVGKLIMITDGAAKRRIHKAIVKVVLAGRYEDLESVGVERPA